MVHLHQCYESLMRRQVNFIQTFFGFPSVQKNLTWNLELKWNLMQLYEQ